MGGKGGGVRKLFQKMVPEIRTKIQGVSWIKHFCHVMKRSDEYSWQIITLNFAKRALPAFFGAFEWLGYAKFSWGYAKTRSLFECCLRRWAVIKRLCLPRPFMKIYPNKLMHHSTQN